MDDFSFEDLVKDARGSHAAAPISEDALLARARAVLAGSSGAASRFDLGALMLKLESELGAGVHAFRSRVSALVAASSSSPMRPAPPAARSAAKAKAPAPARRTAVISSSEEDGKSDESSAEEKEEEEESSVSVVKKKARRGRAELSSSGGSVVEVSDEEDGKSGEDDNEEDDDEDSSVEVVSDDSDASSAPPTKKKKAAAAPPKKTAGKGRAAGAAGGVAAAAAAGASPPASQDVGASAGPSPLKGAKAPTKLASSLPLTVARRSAAAASRTVLVQVEDAKFDLSGDVGAIGRLTTLPNEGLVLDLKGMQYAGTIVPSCSLAVVGFSGGEARIESIVNDFVQLEPLSNVLESLGGCLTSGAVDPALLEFEDVECGEEGLGGSGSEGEGGGGEDDEEEGARGAGAKKKIGERMVGGGGPAKKKAKEPSAAAKAALKGMHGHAVRKVKKGTSGKKKAAKKK